MAKVFGEWQKRDISLFLGYPRVDVTRKLPEIRRAAVDDPYCWLHKFSDREMLGYIEHFKKLSTEIQRNCKQYNLSFVDTSENWPESMQAAYEFVIKQLTAAA